ncbi:unnamed protein product [Lathyrus oleraceus]
MSYSLSSQGTWICEGEINLLSFCFQRSIIDGMKINFFCVFYLFMLINLIRKHSNSNHDDDNPKDRVMVAASICCFLTCIMYLGTFLYDFINRDGEVDHK